MSVPALRACTLAALLAATSGCAFRSQVSGMAVEYNEFVAEATNRQTVINILRARSREPLHFTSFSKVLGTARVEGTANLDIAANGDGADKLPQPGGGFATSRKVLGATNWTPRLGVRINSGTDFEIGINATDDFWKGITTPVAPSTIVHLLRQGWERDLISYLFIHRIEFVGRIRDPAGTVIATLPLARFANAPDNEATVEPFSSLMRCRTLYYGLVEGAGRSEYGINFSENVATDFNPDAQRADCERLERQLRDAFVAGLRAQGLPLPPAAERTSGSGAGPAPSGSADSFSGQANYVAGNQGTEAAPGTALQDGAGFTANEYFRDLVPAGYRADLQIDISLRSVEGLIHYLGEYVR